MTDANSVADIVADALILYVTRHETDIAQKVNDYGELLPVFVALIGRKPRGNPHVRPITHAVSQVLN